MENMIYIGENRKKGLQIKAWRHQSPTSVNNCILYCYADNFMICFSIVDSFLLI